MKIVRFCGRSPNDLYVLLSTKNWELGDPEGLAHWGVAGWRWVQRIDSSFSQQIGFVQNNLVIMDIDANLSFFVDGTLVKRIACPKNIPLGEGIPPPSFYRYAVVNSNDIVIAGDEGCAFIYDQTSWHQIATGTTEKLNDVLERNGSVIVCGNKGTLLEIKGSNCRKVDSETHDDLLQFGSGSDRSVYCLTFASKRFTFVELSGTQLGEGHSLPEEALAMLVLSRNRIVYSTYDMVYLWNGLGATRLMQGYFVSQIEAIGNQIVLASTEQESGKPLFIFDPSQPRFLPVDLDETFLD